MNARASNPIRIVPAAGREAIDTVRALFREYEARLGVSLCFQGFEEEIAGLPGGYAPPSGRLYLAMSGDEPVGCVALRAWKESNCGAPCAGDASSTGAACEMKRLYVRPAARGTGLGRRLARLVVEEARAIGYAAVRLDTLPTMTEAIAMYRTMGFREIGAYRENPVEGAIYMELALAPGLRIEIEGAHEAFDGAGALAWLREGAGALAEELSRRLHARGEARVRIVRDDEMALLHERHTGVAGTTDVLTFDLREDAPGTPGTPGIGAPPAIDADILICADEARRQGALRPGDHAMERELLLYTLHGLLHCLGFDDHDDDAYQRMHALEDEILSAIGVGPVFDSGGGNRAEGPGKR